MRLSTKQKTPQAERTGQQVGVRLIILEEGASGVEPPAPTSEAAPEVAILVRSAGESGSELIERASRCLAILESSDRVVLEAIIDASPAKSQETLATREQLARIVFAHMIRSSGGEITLAAGSDARPELRHELLALAESLTGSASNPSVCVRVVFGAPDTAPEPKKGVHNPPIPALVAGCLPKAALAG